ARSRDRVVLRVTEIVVVRDVEAELSGKGAKRERALRRAVVAGDPGEVAEVERALLGCKIRRLGFVLRFLLLRKERVVGGLSARSFGLVVGLLLRRKDLGGVLRKRLRELLFRFGGLVLGVLGALLELLHLL